MRALFILFIFGHIVSAQNSDIYKRPFQSKPDFDIDVLHYDINLKIYDHEKTFYGKEHLCNVCVCKKWDWCFLKHLAVLTF